MKTSALFYTHLSESTFYYFLLIFFYYIKTILSDIKLLIFWYQKTNFCYKNFALFIYIRIITCTYKVFFLLGSLKHGGSFDLDINQETPSNNPHHQLHVWNNCYQQKCFFWFSMKYHVALCYQPLNNGRKMGCCRYVLGTTHSKNLFLIINVFL